ncbi:MAG: hypothetical protein K2X54_19180 [Methylobacterium organophilum]|nr:hypothetical protein [Methylobacterium organophilum]
MSKAPDDLARIQRLLREDHVLCRDGATMAVLPPDFVSRLQRHDPPVRLRVVPEDPIVKATGLDRYWVHHNRSEGVDAEYAQVPIAVVRAWIRGHGGFHWAGPRALEELQRAGEIEKAQHVAAQAAAADLPPPPPDEPEPPEDVVVPFARPRRLPAPRYPVGHSISSCLPFRRPAPIDR